MLTLQQAQTALQAITTAGGALTTGSMENVKVVYWTPEGESHVRTLNLMAVLNGEDIEQDMLLPSDTSGLCAALHHHENGSMGRSVHRSAISVPGV